MVLRTRGNVHDPHSNPLVNGKSCANDITYIIIQDIQYKRTKIQGKQKKKRVEKFLHAICLLWHPSQNFCFHHYSEQNQSRHLHNKEKITWKSNSYTVKF